MYQKALKMRCKQLGDNHPHIVTTLCNLASVLESQGNYPKAEKMYLEALEMNKKLYGEEHEKTAKILALMSNLMELQGYETKAKSFMRDAVTIKAKLFQKYGIKLPNKLITMMKSQGINLSQD